MGRKYATDIGAPARQGDAMRRKARATISFILGISFDDALAVDLHRRLYENVRLGDWGAQVAVGDIDGSGKEEIVVGRGEGVGNGTGMSIFTGAGEELSTRKEVYPASAFGVNLAVGRF